MYKNSKYAINIYQGIYFELNVVKFTLKLYILKIERSFVEILSEVFNLINLY